jgi:hypothetical protein
MEIEELEGLARIISSRCWRYTESRVCLAANREGYPPTTHDIVRQCWGRVPSGECTEEQWIGAAPRMRLGQVLLLA